MNTFWLPSDANCETVYQLGGVQDELSLVVHSNYIVDFPPLPVLFAYQIGLWVAVEYSEVKPKAKKYCFHLKAFRAASLHELAKFAHGNVRDGFCIAVPSYGSPGPDFLSKRQQRMFESYCEARANLREALSNMHRAEASRDQANGLLRQTEVIWRKAEGMLASIEESCREAGFHPIGYLENKADA